MQEVEQLTVNKLQLLSNQMKNPFGFRKLYVLDQQEQQQVYVEESETPAETPSYDAPAEETPAADNNSDNNASDPNSGCLGDEGLFN